MEIISTLVLLFVVVGAAIFVGVGVMGVMHACDTAKNCRRELQCLLWIIIIVVVAILLINI